MRESEWIRRFAARRCNLFGETDVHRHLERARLVYQSMSLLDPADAASMDVEFDRGAPPAGEGQPTDDH